VTGGLAKKWADGLTGGLSTQAANLIRSDENKETPGGMDELTKGINTFKNVDDKDGFDNSTQTNRENQQQPTVTDSTDWEPVIDQSMISNIIIIVVVLIVVIAVLKGLSKS